MENRLIRIHYVKHKLLLDFNGCLTLLQVEDGDQVSRISAAARCFFVFKQLKPVFKTLFIV